ncbi:MAG: phytochrome two-component sensor histidine kinase [Bacteroidetes bacterium]|nr:phytochrome two-component sensor histidine kinase [Bacteroidota bacterium]
MTPSLYHDTFEIHAGQFSKKTPTSIKKASLMELIVSGYLSIQNLGTEYVDKKNQVKYIQISNFIAMTSFISSIFYIGLALIWAKVYWFLCVDSLCVTSVAVLTLNKFGRINASRILFLIATNFSLYFAALFTGPLAGGENFLLISVMLPFLIYDLQSKAIIAMGVSIPIVLMFSFHFIVPYFAVYHPSVPQQLILQKMGAFMEISLVIAAVYQFVYHSRETERNLEISNVQMTSQTEELKRSNGDLEQFAYVISHDLKTPVRNISCFMKLLSNKHGGTFNAEAREFVDFSLAGAKRMERLIDDVLAYSRIGRNLSSPTPVNVADVINTIRIEQQDKLKVVNGIMNIAGELPVIKSVHSSLMYHILQNLIRNGLKFNRSANPTINISYTETESHYKFSVQDNGIGISQDYAVQVFQMFKRLHNENEYDGTGIGLAICKKIVELYHGEIWYEGQEGKGTTFHFTIRKF